MMVYTMSTADATFKKLIDNGVSESAWTLKQQVIEYIEFINQIMEDNPDLFDDEHESDLMFILEFFQRIDAVELMSLFIKRVLPYTAQIRNCDEKFFQENVLKLFSDLPQEKVYFIYDIFVNNRIDQEDKEANWDYWGVFVSLAEKNKKSK